MNFVEQLELNKNNYTKTDLYICDYILKDLNLVINHTISMLATKIDTSTAAITRFTRKAGFENYNAFRTACIQYCSSDIKEETTDENKLQQISNVYAKAISYIPFLVDEKQIMEVVKDIKNEQVKVLGSYRSSLPATMLKYDLIPHGKHVEFIDSQVANYELGNIFKKDDLLVVFSISLNSKETNPVIDEALEKGIDIILITMQKDCEYKDRIKHFIQIPSVKSLGHHMLLDDTVMQFAFVNILVNYYSSQI